MFVCYSLPLINTIYLLPADGRIVDCAIMPVSPLCIGVPGAGK